MRMPSSSRSGFNDSEYELSDVEHPRLMAPHFEELRKKYPGAFRRKGSVTSLTSEPAVASETPRANRSRTPKLKSQRRSALGCHADPQRSPLAHLENSHPQPKSQADSIANLLRRPLAERVHQDQHQLNNMLKQAEMYLSTGHCDLAIENNGASGTLRDRLRRNRQKWRELFEDENDPFRRLAGSQCETPRSDWEDPIPRFQDTGARSYDAKRKPTQRPLSARDSIIIASKRPSAREIPVPRSLQSMSHSATEQTPAFGDTHSTGTVPSTPNNLTSAGGATSPGKSDTLQRLRELQTRLSTSLNKGREALGRESPRVSPESKTSKTVSPSGGSSLSETIRSLQELQGRLILRQADLKKTRTKHSSGTGELAESNQPSEYSNSAVNKDIVPFVSSQEAYIGRVTGSETESVISENSSSQNNGAKPDRFHRSGNKFTTQSNRSDTRSRHTNRPIRTGVTDDAPEFPNVSQSRIGRTDSPDSVERNQGQGLPRHKKTSSRVLFDRGFDENSNLVSGVDNSGDSPHPASLSSSEADSDSTLVSSSSLVKIHSTPPSHGLPISSQKAEGVSGGVSPTKSGPVRADHAIVTPVTRRKLKRLAEERRLHGTNVDTSIQSTRATSGSNQTSEQPVRKRDKVTFDDKVLTTRSRSHSSLHDSVGESRDATIKPTHTRNHSHQDLTPKSSASRSSPNFKSSDRTKITKSDPDFASSGTVNAGIEATQAKSTPVLQESDNLSHTSDLPKLQYNSSYEPITQSRSNLDSSLVTPDEIGLSQLDLEALNIELPKTKKSKLPWNRNKGSYTPCEEIEKLEQNEYKRKDKENTGSSVLGKLSKSGKHMEKGKNSPKDNITPSPAKMSSDTALYRDQNEIRFSTSPPEGAHTIGYASSSGRIHSSDYSSSQGARPVNTGFATIGYSPSGRIQLSHRQSGNPHEKAEMKVSRGGNRMTSIEFLPGGVPTDSDHDGSPGSSLHDSRSSRDHIELSENNSEPVYAQVKKPSRNQSNATPDGAGSLASDGDIPDLIPPSLKDNHFDSNWDVQRGSGLRNSFSERFGSIKKSAKKTMGRLRRAVSMDRLDKADKEVKPEVNIHDTPTLPGRFKKSPSFRSLTERLSFRRKDKNKNHDKQDIRKVPTPQGSPMIKPSKKKSVSMTSLDTVETPRNFRPIGKLKALNADGSRVVEMVKPPHGPFGFYLKQGNAYYNYGVYLSRLSDGLPERFFAGLLAVGDEILEIDNTPVTSLSVDEVYDLMAEKDQITLKTMPSSARNDT